MSEPIDICLLEPELQLGVVSSISAGNVKINLDQASRPTATAQRGHRYGLGEVGEFVLIEGESSHLLGRIIETKLPEKERLSVEPNQPRPEPIHPIGTVMLLGTFDVLEDKIRPGVQQYPRLGARVHSAPHEFLARLPSYLDSKLNAPEVTLDLGTIKSASSTEVRITPERIFGRHCAILGTTGGGKSFTVSRLLGECMKHNAKVILLDATGEYRSLAGESITNVSLLGGTISPDDPASSAKCKFPLTELTESDFMALFQPSGRSQAPLFREALKSLRLLKQKPELGEENSNVLKKANREKKPITTAQRECASIVESPSSPFDVGALAMQIGNECVYDSRKTWEGETGNRKQVVDGKYWGEIDMQALGYVQSLLVRINSILASDSFAALFQGGDQDPDLTREFEAFFQDSSKCLLRLSVENISFENSAREILANLIGRWLLGKARKNAFRESPLVVILDEAHQFLNKSFGVEEATVRLDAFDLIAKEGRKYGLNICIATQRPRDLPEGVLSQMGTLVVHRLTNDRDREIVERACGEIDRSASAFLPNLQPGEAALIGVDFPIPMTIQIKWPEYPPKSSGPDYQNAWKSVAPSSLPLPRWTV